MGTTPRIGANLDDLLFKLNGSIDSVVVYNRSLSIQQITALYFNQTNKIVSQETETGENWTVAVTPNDGMQDGLTVTSNTIEISLGDDDPPAVFHPHPAIGSKYSNQTIQIEINATDITAVDKVWVNITRIGGSSKFFLTRFGTSPKYNKTYTIPNFVGVFNITYYANDTLGYLNSTTLSNFTADYIKPVINIISPNVHVYNTNKILINFTATDNVAMNNYFWRNGTGGNNITYTVPRYSNKTYGNYTYRFYANDTYGNLQQKNYTVYLNAPPNITKWFPISLVNYSNAIFFNATIEDDKYNLTMNYTLDGIETSRLVADNGTLTYSYASSSGSHLVKLTVSDIYGRTTTKTWSISPTSTDIGSTGAGGGGGALLPPPTPLNKTSLNSLNATTSVATGDWKVPQELMLFLLFGLLFMAVSSGSKMFKQITGKDDSEDNKRKKYEKREKEIEIERRKLEIKKIKEAEQ
jgi:hypothetical protein